MHWHRRRPRLQASAHTCHLTPMAPNPASMAMVIVPESRRPHCAAPRSQSPATWQPHPSGSIPVPIPSRPDVSGAGCSHHHFGLGRRGRRWSGDNHARGRLSHRHSHRRWRGHIRSCFYDTSAGEQCCRNHQRRDCINLFCLISHIVPFLSPIRNRARFLAT